MSERPFMQLYVSDYLGDTRHLSCEQHGAYLLLLMTMWNAGGSLPDDDARLARIVCLSLKKWRAISTEMLGFFERADGEITHRRLTRELLKASAKSEARAAAGARGGLAKSLKSRQSASANAGPLPWHSPDSRVQIEKAPAFQREREAFFATPSENAQRSSQSQPPSENAQHFSQRPSENAQRSSHQRPPAENAQRFSASGNAQRSHPTRPKKPSGWHQPKTHLDAANTIIEEIRNHDDNGIAAGGEGAGGDVLMLPAIRAR